MTRSGKMIESWTAKSVKYYSKKVKGSNTLTDDVNFLLTRNDYALRLSKSDMLLCSNYAKKLTGYKGHI